MDSPDAISSLRYLHILDWVPLVVNLIRGIRQLIQHQWHEGLYEVLNYDSTLELIDAKGEIAVFKKQLRVKFLQDNVIAFEDYAWGDGELFADYRCSPGIVADRYQEGNRWNVLISLRQTKSSGDVEEFQIERKVLRGFMQNEEWWQIAMQNQTNLLQLSIIFPKQRHCQRVVLVERSRNRTTELMPENFSILPDGRQVIRWETAKPRRFETYTLKWQW